MIELSVKDARRIALHAQGLMAPAAFGRGNQARNTWLAHNTF